MPRAKQFDEMEVLKRAIELFWKQGYNATSMSDLVKHLGINRASLYDTFGSKRQLFDRALDHYRNENICDLRAFLAQQTGVKAGIEALFERAIADTMTDTERKGCFVVNATTELAPLDKEIQQLGLENRQHIELIFQEFLQKGIERGEISADKDIIALSAFIFVLYNGIQVIAKVERERDKLITSIQPALSLLS